MNCQSTFRRKEQPPSQFFSLRRGNRGGVSRCNHVSTHIIFTKEHKHMNEENFLKLIQAVEEADPREFHMHRFVNACGTPACVLGNYAAREDLQSAFRIKEGDIL